MSDQDVVKRDEAVNPLALAVEQFPLEEQEKIALFLAVPATDPGFLPFLGIAAHLGLSPILGEIWLIKGRRKDPETGAYVDFYKPTVGRDGLLKYAKRDKSYRALRSGVVCANDTFEVEDDGFDTKIVHRLASLQPGLKKGHESRWRGPVVGAWAKLFFSDDRPPLFYFAPAHEHVQTKVKDGEKEFVGAWSYTSSMIAKSAQSYVLRIGFGVTGIVPLDELRVDDPQMVGSEPPAAGEAPVSIADDPDPANASFIDTLDDLSSERKRDLKTALEAVNELSPFSWTPSKLRMKLGSECSEDRAAEVLAEVEGEFTALRERQVEQEAEEVADAIQVVAAKDVQAGVELCIAAEGEGDENAWVLVEDVLVDDGDEIVAFKLAGGGEETCRPDHEVEVRQPEPPAEQQD